MKLCVVKKDNKLVCVKTNAPHTPGCIGHIPSNTSDIDRQFIVETANGVEVSKKLKSQWLKEQIKNGQV